MRPARAPRGVDVDGCAGNRRRALDQDCATLTDRLPVLDNGAVSISTPELGDEVARALGQDGSRAIEESW